MSEEHWTDKLHPYMPCVEGIQWASEQPDASTAWTNCKRPDWLLWVVACLDHKEGVRLSYICARLTLVHVSPDNRKPWEVLKAVKNWLKGEMPAEQVKECGMRADIGKVFDLNNVPYAASDAACLSASFTAYSIDSCTAAIQIGQAAKYAAICLAISSVKRAADYDAALLNEQEKLCTLIRTYTDIPDIG